MKALEYIELLKNHDWFYYQSDSRSVYERGKKSEEELIRLYTEHTHLKKYYFRYLKMKTKS